MTDRAKILVVENKPAVSMTMVYWLTQAGCETEVAATGAKAMQLALEEKFDLIILGVDLPDINGFEVCHELKHRHFSRQTPVVFVSGRATIEDQQRGLELGAADYITEPFDALDLVRRLLSHVEPTSVMA